MPIYSVPGPLLISATANTTGLAADLRACGNAAYLHIANDGGASAIVTLQAAPVPDSGWLPALTYTATATAIITAQSSAFYPFARAVATIYSGAGQTGRISVLYVPQVN
jgi:hypothetical protein